jgi:hypothetical protein
MMASAMITNKLDLLDTGGANIAVLTLQVTVVGLDEIFAMNLSITNRYKQGQIIS